MPSTYSTNLKLELMATGEDSGTWGDNTNNNLGTLIEEAIIGVGSVAMADSNQTIAIANGVTSTARKVFITCTGALSANRNLVVPTIDKNYVITNSTTGGFSVVVKTAAGTGITVGPGLKRFLEVDGTNVVDAINSVGDLTVAGNATVVGTISLGAVIATSFNKVAITAPATSATLTIADGKTLTASNTLTFTGTDGNSFAFPAGSDTVATIAATQTLSNKTLASGTIATTQAPGDSSTKVATTAFVAAAVAVGMPTGGIIPYGGSVAPTGWLLCDATSYTTAAQPSLFAIIGYTFGGSGANFNVPDMRGRVPAGVDGGAGRLGSGATGGITGTASLGVAGGEQSHVQTLAEMRAHTHAVPSNIQAGNDIQAGPGLAAGLINDGSSGSSGTSAAANILQPTLVLNYIIKT